MDVDLALIADAATVDGNGKLNILGIFDRITVARFPAKHGRVSLVLRFIGGATDAGNHELTIRMVDPSGQEMVSLTGELKVAPGPGSLMGGLRIPHVLNLDGLVFREPGRYNFEVTLDGEHQVSLSLAVESPPSRSHVS